jgi:hypothetical protein
VTESSSKEVNFSRISKGRCKTLYKLQIKSTFGIGVSRNLSYAYVGFSHSFLEHEHLFYQVWHKDVVIDTSSSSERIIRSGGPELPCWTRGWVWQRHIRNHTRKLVVLVVDFLYLRTNHQEWWTRACTENKRFSFFVNHNVCGSTITMFVDTSPTWERIFGGRGPEHTSSLFS